MILFQILLLFFINSIGISQGHDMTTDRKYSTCPINLTVTIDFSDAMQNYNNIKYLIDFILNNFTNKLPFNDPNFNIALLSYGTINGSRMFGPFKNYEDFSSVVYQQWDISQKYKLQKASLNETLWKYWDYIIDGQEVENLKCSEDTYCLHKLVLFTAIDDIATLTDAFDIASKIYNHSFVIAVGINLTHSITLIDIGRRVYNIFFDDFYLWKETPLDLYLQDVLCKMNIKTPKQVSCGKGYCESILCGYHDTFLRCQYFTGCILNKCYYWRHSVLKWSLALKYCEVINSRLVTINDEKVQEEIYGIIGDYEYWIGLYYEYWSGPYVNPTWTWSGPSKMSLGDTNYTNWGKDQPDTNYGTDFCVSDTNSSELIQNWKVLPCENSTKQRVYLCEKETTIPYHPEPKNYKLYIILSAGLVFIIIFSILIIGVIIYKNKRSTDGNLEPYETTERNRTISSNTTQTTPTTLNIFPPIPNFSPILNFPPVPKSASSMLARMFGLINNFNKLSFFPDAHVYEYNRIDLQDLGLLAATRHQIKKFRHLPSKIEFAAKLLIIPFKQVDDEEILKHYSRMLNEIENFRKLQKCSNIVKFYGLCKHGEHILLCMELMDLSLKELYVLVHKKNRFPEEIIGYIFVQILDALIYMSSMKILHRDIKPDNVLANKNGAIKVCDFGESRILSDSLLSKDVGTKAYWPPERFNADNIPNDNRSEVWSLGITLMEFILGLLPYKLDEISIQNYITKTNFAEMIEEKIRPDYSKDLCNLLEMCTYKLENRSKLGVLKTTIFYDTHKNINKDQVAPFFSSILPNQENLLPSQ